MVGARGVTITLTHQTWQFLFQVWVCSVGCGPQKVKETSESVHNLFTKYKFHKIGQEIRSKEKCCFEVLDLFKLPINTSGKQMATYFSP